MDNSSAVESPEEKFQRWLVEFGTWMDRTSHTSTVARALGISPQTAGRYFVHRTHDCPAIVFIRAIIWFEKLQSENYERWQWRHQKPGVEFQKWQFAGRIPELEKNAGTAGVSKSGKKSGRK